MNEKFLIIQTAFLGDVILTTPLIRHLTNSRPGCEVHIVSTPLACEILKSLPQVFTYAYDKKNGGLFKSFLGIKKQLTVHKFKAVYCVHKSPRSLLLGASVKAGIKYAFSSALAKVLGYQTVDYPDYANDTHYVDKVLRLVSDTNIKRAPWLVSSAEEKKSFQKNHENISKPYVVVSPYSAWGTKMWPQEKYFEVVEQFIKKTDYDVVLTGTAADMIFFNEKKNLLQNSRIKNLIGKTSVSELKILIENSKLLLANDSAPIHIAAAFNIPVVAVFGPTVRKWGFFPLSEKAIICEIQEPLSCRPCSLHGPKICPQQHFRCMKEVSVPQVWQAIERFL